MQFTGAIQSQELDRLQSLQSDQPLETVPAARFLEMKDRVDAIALGFAQKEFDYQHQIQELRTREQFLSEEKRALTAEADDLKQANALLGQEIASLKVALDALGAEMGLQAPCSAQELVLNERLLKTEAALEQQRAEVQRLLREGQRIQSERNELQYRLVTLQERVERIQQSAVTQDHEDKKLLEEMNEQNKELQEQTRLLREEAAKAQQPVVQMVPGQFIQDIKDKLE